MLRCVLNDVVPALAFAVGALTLLVPFAIIRATHTFVGGLAWPFVADLSRDFPSSAVFAVGLNTLGLLLTLIWTLNYRRHQRFLENALLDEASITSFRRISWQCTIIGTIGAIVLPCYAFTEVSSSPQRLAGAAFLVLEALACIINSYLSYRICLVKREELETGVFVTIKHAPRSVAVEKLTALKKAKRGFLVELACSALFMMSLLVYLPLMYQTAPAQQLKIQDCVSRGLGDHYCNETVRAGGDDTILWDYSVDFAGYQVRAFAQLGCLLTLLAYTLSFVVSNNEKAEDEQDGRDRLFHAAVSRESPLLGGDNASPGRRRSQSRASSPAKRRMRSPSGSPPKPSVFSPKSPSGPGSYISV